MSAGRPRKPTELHIAEGTLRADRHGDGASAVLAAGRPAKPVFDDVHADWFWDEMVDMCYWLSAADASILEVTCHMYGLYRCAYQIAMQDPTDKDARIAVTSYWSKFEKGCSVLGLNPTDRGRLQVEKPKPQGVRRRQG